MRKYTGNVPKGGVLVAEEHGWQLYRLAQKSAGWCYVKLIAAPGQPMPGKANYWLAWGVDSQRFSGSSDLTVLRRYHPTLHDWARDQMRGTAPTARTAVSRPTEAVARDEDYKAGYKAGYKVGYEVGYEEGYSAGCGKGMRDVCEGAEKSSLRMVHR